MNPTSQIAVYWFVGFALALTYLRDEISHFDWHFDWQRLMFFAFGLVVVGLNGYIYSSVTYASGRPLDGLTLFVFTIGNGIFETLIFLSLLKLGYTLTKKVTESKWIIFLVGFAIFCIFSGAIHGLFWLKILPKHMSETPAAMQLKPIFFPIQIGIALSWSFLFFKYRDVWLVIVLHALVDATMVWCVRFSMFT
jgi:membrane protease YdiL (CAAX protease family)